VPAEDASRDFLDEIAAEVVVRWSPQLALFEPVSGSPEPMRGSPLDSAHHAFTIPFSKDMRTSVPPRGRPRARSKSASILESALELIARDGYAAASMDAVALHAGVSKPTIYKRHSSKLQLALAAVDHLAGQLRVAADQRPDVDPVRQFERELAKSNTVALLGAVIAAGEGAPGLGLQFRNRVLIPQLRSLSAQLERRMDSKAAADAASAALGRAVVKILSTRSGRTR
jgi:AcrR family transcriptional regulator